MPLHPSINRITYFLRILQMQPHQKGVWNILMNTFKEGREGAKGLITNFEKTIRTSSDEEKLKKLQKNW